MKIAKHRETEKSEKLPVTKSKMHVGLGLQLPTAKLDAEGLIPPANAVLRIPYPMQLGQGTLALQPSITYIQENVNWSLGSQLKGNIQLADNSEDYRPGSSAEGTVWVARNISEKASVSFRLKGSIWGNVSGSDSDILPLPVPTTRTDLRGGFRFDAAIGLNLYNILGPLDAGVEISKPLYQNLEGPQLGRDWDVTLGLKYHW